MDQEPRTIIFSLVYRGETHRIATYPNEFLSLMVLISHHLAPLGFGICGGMGSCGTCLVHLRYKNLQNGRHELACETFVNDELSGMTVEVPDDSR